MSSCCADLVVGTPQIAVVLAAPITPAVGVALALPAVLAAMPIAAVMSTPVIPVVSGALRDLNAGATEPLCWNGAPLFWDGDVLMIGVTY